MNSEAPTPTAVARLQREALRRGLRRSNFAWVVILAVVAALAFGVVWKAGQFAREAERANQNAATASEQAGRALAATTRAEAELWNTRLAEARATRLAGGPGARVKAGEIIAQLSRQPGLGETQTLALRAEAIAHLALLDVDFPPGWTTQRNAGRSVWDAAYQRRVDSSGTNRLDIFDAASGRILQTLDGTAGRTRFETVFSPDGNYLAVFFNPASPYVLAWRIADGALVASNRLSGPSASFFSPDSRTLAVATARGLELHSLLTGGPPRVLRDARQACFSPDAQSLAFVSGTSAEVFSLETMELLHRIKLPFQTSIVAWSPTGGRLAISGHQGELALWELPFAPAAENAAVPGALRLLEGHATTIIHLSFSPDGGLLLSQGWDSVSSFWEVNSGRRLLAETRGMVDGFSPDGARLTAKGREISVRVPVVF